MRYACMLFALVLATGASVATPTPALAQSADWTIDSAHSAAEFAVKHLMVSTVRGRLGRVTGTVRFDGKNVAGLVINVSIDPTGIDTQEPRRDADLKSANFFDVEKFPAVTFKSKRAEAGAAGHFKVVGDLTMHGVTKEVVLDVEGPSAPVRQGATTIVGATATAKINRSDFGLTWNRAIEAGGVVVSDEVGITIDVALVRQAAAPPDRRP